MAKCGFYSSKRDALFTIACIVFVVANLGAIGTTGRRRAKEAVCLSNLRQWGVMFNKYTSDNNGYFNRGWDVGEKALWMNALRPYYKDNWDLLLCPTAKIKVSSMNDMGTFKAWYRNTNLPDGGEYRYVGSYSINNWTNYMTKDRGQRLKRFFWKNVNGVKGKNNIPVFADATWHDAWPRHTDSPPEHPDDFGTGSPGSSDEMKHFCIDRHNGAVGGLFMDWSARKIGLKELWTLKWHREFDTGGPWTRAGGIRPTDWPAWMRNFKDF